MDEDIEYRKAKFAGFKLSLVLESTSKSLSYIASLERKLIERITDILNSVFKVSVALNISFMDTSFLL